eukprot:s4703_g2.t1
MSNRPFLLTETQGVEPSWLEEWPLGGVALVVGGSVDMRTVRKHVKEDLKSKEIEIYMLHATLWGRRFRPRAGKYLLLATETLFSKKFSGLRNRLWVVFDMCEKHEMLQPEPSSEEMQWLRQFGRCDVLLTVSITPEEQLRRRRLLGTRYHPNRRVFVADQVVSKWQLSTNQIWNKAGRLPFVGFPLPDVYSNDTFWDQLFGWSTDESHFREQQRGDFVSFNSLPLNFLLEEITKPQRSQDERSALSLVVCAVQLVSSRGFAPIFQHKRALTFDPQTVWDITETSVLMDLFLSAAGKWSKEATLAFLALQYKQRTPIKKLRNLEDRTFSYYLREWESALCLRFEKLLDEMMWLMLDFYQALVDDLHRWCATYSIAGDPPLRHPSWPDFSNVELGTFLETVMIEAAIAASNVNPVDLDARQHETEEILEHRRSQSVQPFEFVFPFGRKCELRGCRFHRRPSGHRSIRVEGEKNSSGLKWVLWWHFHRSEYHEDRSGAIEFSFEPGSGQEDRLLASVTWADLANQPGKATTLQEINPRLRGFRGDLHRFDWRAVPSLRNM